MDDKEKVFVHAEVQGNDVDDVARQLRLLADRLEGRKYLTSGKHQIQDDNNLYGYQIFGPVPPSEL